MTDKVIIISVLGHETDD